MISDDDDDDDLPGVLPDFQRPRSNVRVAAVRAKADSTASAEALPARLDVNVKDSDVDAVLAFCPELSRADIRRDLLVSGSAQSTINRFLDGQFLDGVPEPTSNVLPVATKHSGYTSTLSRNQSHSGSASPFRHDSPSPVRAYSPSPVRADSPPPIRTRAFPTSAIFGDESDISISDGDDNDDDLKMLSRQPVATAPSRFTATAAGKGEPARRDSIDSRSFSLIDYAETHDIDELDDTGILAAAAGRATTYSCADGNTGSECSSGSSVRLIGVGGVASGSGTRLTAWKEKEQCLPSDGSDSDTVRLDPLPVSTKRKRLTAEEHAEQKRKKDREREAKKSQKAAEKQQKQLDKAREKAAKKISAESRQANNREQSLKMMRLLADSRLWDFPHWAAIFDMLTGCPESGGFAADSRSAADKGSSNSNAKAASAAVAGASFGVVVEEERLPVANSVRWRRQVVHGAFDEDSQDIVRETQSIDEGHAAVLWTAEEFAQCILQCEGDDSSIQLSGRSLQDAFDEMEVTLVLVGVKSYLGQCKNAGNRDFRSAVRRLGDTEDDPTVGGDGGGGGGVRRKATKKQQPTASVTQVQVDDMLVALQLLCPKLRVRQTETPFETARLLFQMTKSVAHDPARKADTTPFSFYAEGQSLKPVKIDNNGVGCGRAWQQQLRQIHGVGHDKAAAISQTFPSPRHLLQECLKCENGKQIDQLMTGIEVRRGMGVMGRTTHVGKDFGRQLHRYITSRDGDELIDGSGRSTD
ncbi:crossover junction endonuclease EME1-like [Sycon ciliatum]|uniref:crossover junction endonuclease EME1-like n=1 Tax=Sycon ciliatum TaxID=27933 RepID=UPI0031F6FCC1